MLLCTASEQTLEVGSVAVPIAFVALAPFNYIVLQAAHTASSSAIASKVLQQLARAREELQHIGTISEKLLAKCAATIAPQQNSNTSMQTDG